MAEGQIAKLEQHRLGGDDRRLWKNIVRLISNAKEQAYLGEFAQARANCCPRSNDFCLLATTRWPIRLHLAGKNSQKTPKSVPLLSLPYMTP